MNDRKDLIREYKGKKKDRLDTVTHRNAALQAEWKSFGVMLPCRMRLLFTLPVKDLQR